MTSVRPVRVHIDDVFVIVQFSGEKKYADWRVVCGALALTTGSSQQLYCFFGHSGHCCTFAEHN